MRVRFYGNGHMYMTGPRDQIAAGRFVSVTPEERFHAAQLALRFKIDTKRAQTRIDRHLLRLRVLEPHRR